MVSRVLFLCATSLLTAAFSGATASAQTDRLFPAEGEMVLGQIKDVRKSGIVMTVSGKEQTFAAGEIEKVLFQGDPPSLTQGRQFALDGQYEQALEQLRNVDTDDLTRDIVKADAAYYTLLAEAKLALRGKGDLGTAAKSAIAFARSHGNSWRFYDVAKLLGDLAVATGNYEQAMRYYSSLRAAPSTDTKIESVYLTGLVHLANNDLSSAETALSQIIGLNQLTSVAALRLKDLSSAGMAIVKAKQGSGEEASALINTLIEKLNPADTEIAARVYNAQGAAYEAMGDDEGAILAYLHTHLMFSSDAATHVQSLKRLAELWTKVGKPDRAAQARGELQQRYPGLSS